MNSTAPEPLKLTREEMTLLSELLESERDELLVEIRHTDHRTFRDDLKHRLALVESLLERCNQGERGAASPAG